jgi:hypothetical protein
LVRALGDPAIIALGKTAAGVLTDLGLVHGYVPHPQYWRRFCRRYGPGSYAATIKEQLK